MDEQIREAVACLQPRKHPGSNVAPKTLYHDLPFEGFDEIPAHRKQSRQRWDLIQAKSGVSFSGKHVIDIGCSVGAMSLLAAKAGAATVTGYDYDQESLNIAKLAATKMKLQGMRFIYANIKSDFLKHVNKVDIILWLANWMWMVKQHGMEAAKDMLFDASMKAKEMIFESAANDGMARIPDCTQEKIGKWLWECTGYSQIKDIGFARGWNNRHVFVCRAPINVWKGFTAMIQRISRTTMRKQFRRDFWWMAEREIQCMRRLEKYPNFPRILGHGPGYVDITYCGNREDISAKRDQAMAILDALEAENIVHRDVNPKNLLMLNGKMHLVDFGWALLDDEKESEHKAPAALGGKYYRNNKWDDRKAMEISLKDGVYKRQ